MVSGVAGGVLGKSVFAGWLVHALAVTVPVPQNTEGGRAKVELSVVVVAAASVNVTVEAGIPSVALGDPACPAAHQALPPVMWTVSPPLPVVLLAARTEAFGVVPLKMTEPTLSGACVARAAMARVQPGNPALICAWDGGHSAAGLVAVNVAGHVKLAVSVPVALVVFDRFAAAMSAKSDAPSLVPRDPASRLAGARATAVLAGKPVQLMAIESPGVTFGMKFWAAVPPAVVSW
jgi:hypothetical protein